jgi:D-alanyl-D-alanine dipeptidase
MDLIAISPPAYDVVIDLAYATSNNVTGAPIYRHARCYLHRDAADCLAKAINLAAPLGYRLKIFDAFRPSEAQWVLWKQFPQPGFFADPRKGSPHSRGAAVDLTLVDTRGMELEMGTGFDDLTEHAYHACLDVSATAQRNRAVLLGLMTAAGWDFYRNEWWHYQLFDARRYPLYSDSALKAGLM